MAVTPLQARCRRCGHDFFLNELREATGNCPRCGATLTLEPALLLDEARRAEFAQRHLIDALRRMANVSGDVALRPHTIVRNILGEVGWHRALGADPALLGEEARELRALVAAWEQRAPEPPQDSGAPSHGRARSRGRRRRHPVPTG